MELYTEDGYRKYLTSEERASFKQVCNNSSREHRTFALMLYHTGCRISEALNLKRSSIDVTAGHVVFETLKRRKRGVIRAVPIPEDFIRSIDDVYDVRSGKDLEKPLWGFSRTTGWRIIQELMTKADLKGVQACPKGLRHGFAIACVEKNIPINMISKWMGHADMETTAIYANASGKEERGLIARLWT